MMEPISFKTSDSRTLRGTGLHAIGRIFGQAAEALISVNNPFAIWQRNIWILRFNTKFACSQPHVFSAVPTSNLRGHLRGFRQEAHEENAT